MNVWPLQDLHGWSLGKKGIESSLKCIDRKTAVPAEGLKSLTLEHPFSEPNKTILQPLRSIITGKQDATVLTLKPLLFLPGAPPDYR